MTPNFIIRSMFILLPVIMACGRSPSAPQAATWQESEREHLLSELQRSTTEVNKICEGIPERYWAGKDSGGWSAADILEHLIVQNELHYREIRAISKTPPNTALQSFTTDQDNYFTGYANDPVRSSAQWFLEPVGRFCTKEASVEAFNRVRLHFYKYVSETEVDMRRHMTYRRQLMDIQQDSIRPGDVRDLHQLVLTGIAHTDRHLRQLKDLHGRLAK